ncbi:amidohydrolase [Paenibacillus mesophilus]|uniref:amidohydrolase family protein n=1 Tax=Paenibacillus mesophilus TaxID=2582849 RepID=UPI00110D5D93|nr:amidohydrolase family protein [Paenibacillus mesophilus]TMV50217.1 amidohydrolase [Paenibacillus mesophilus]
MIIDMHTHVWGGRYELHTRELIANCERYGIGKIIVSGIARQYPDETDIDRHNRDIVRFRKERPGLVEGYVYVNPRHANAVDVLRRGIEEDGMVGLKLWIATYCDDPLVYPLVERCIRLDVPILLHAFHKAVNQLPDETTGVHIAKLADRYPEAKLIMAHLGGNAYHGIKAIRDKPNVWTDFSGSLFGREDIDYAVSQLGSDRVLFGSDMPGCSFITNYAQVQEADLSPQQREDIYSNNARKLFRLIS